ncbi:MAG: hypothetical protein Q7U28_20135 [Aquabacterium sp.]|nr:hypothetical protein [Aquabacterium sp.]
MNKLPFELRRLYLSHLPEDQIPDAAAPSLADADGMVRAVVLQLAKPADWSAMSAVWQGVQADLALPAPAIAVNGTDGYQLWFSLVEPVPLPQALAFLDALRVRYLPGIAPECISLMPAVGMVPALQAQTEQWSAFVAPDLAPVFADAPWLDIPPSLSGQADLLARLGSIKPAAFQAAWAQLSPDAGQQALQVQGHPKHFLLNVMNDTGVPLGLRIEAAKALLPYCD